MAGRAQDPHGAEHTEPGPTPAHWPQARQPAPNGYANHPDHYAQQQPQQPGANGYNLPHEIQAPLPPQPRHDWSNPNGIERDLRAFAQIGREQQHAEPAYPQHQPHAQGHFQPQPQAPAEQWHAAAQTHGYPGQHQQAYPGQHAGYQDPQLYGHGQAQDPRYAQWPEQPAHAAEPYNLDHYAQQGQAGYPTQAQLQQGQDIGEHAEIEEYEEESERRRGPRAIVVICALVGALAIGGGLAYGYRMLGGSSKGKDGKPPVVKADTAPAKVKPTDGGGKDVAHTDKKFLNRLTEDGKATAAAASPAAPTPAASATPNEPEAPRKVTTLVVNRDGTLTPQANLAPPSPPQPAPAVPGMVLEGGPRAPLRGAASETPPPAAPKVADLPLPRVKTEPPQAQAVSFPAPAEPRAAEPKATIAKKKPAPRDDAATPQATATAAVPAPSQAKATVSSGGGAVLGFVPVLTSKKTREEALKSFADLHQKYPDILGSKSPDVVQADIPEKGTFFRLIVGPPGSREAGREICNKLDAQGYKGCWITAYRQ